MDIMKYLMFSISSNLRFFVEFYYEQIREKGQFDEAYKFGWSQVCMRVHYWVNDKIDTMIQLQNFCPCI